MAGVSKTVIVPAATMQALEERKPEDMTVNKFMAELIMEGLRLREEGFTDVGELIDQYVAGKVSIKESVRTTNSELQALFAKTAELNERHDQDLVRLNELNGHLVKTQEHLASAEADNARLSERVQVLSRELEAAEQLLTDHSSSSSSKDSSEELRAATKEIASLNDALMVAQKDNSKKAATITSQTMLLEKRNAEVTQLREELEKRPATSALSKDSKIKRRVAREHATMREWFQRCVLLPLSVVKALEAQVAHKDLRYNWRYYAMLLLNRGVEYADFRLPDGWMGEVDTQIPAAIPVEFITD